MSKILEIDLQKIIPSKSNPRTHFDGEALSELTASIQEHGVLQPITVRLYDEAVAGGATDIYEIVFGERRYRASILGGLKTIPAIVKNYTDEEVLEIQILENLQREDVSPMDEAKAFKSILGKENLEWLASKINKSTKYVLNRIKLLDLAEELHEDLENGRLPLGHAYALTRLPKEEQLKTYQFAVNGESLSNFKNRIKYSFLTFDKAPFDVDDETLLPKVGGCNNCHKRTINNQLLFEDITSEDRCTDEICFNAKIKNYWEKIKNKAFEKYGEIPVVETSYDGILYDENDYEFSREKTEEFSFPVYVEKNRFYWQKDKEDLLGFVVFIKPEEHSKDNDDSEDKTVDWKFKRTQNTLNKVQNFVLPRLSIVDQIKSADLKDLGKFYAVEILSESNALPMFYLSKKLGYKGGLLSELNDKTDEELVLYFDELPYDKKNSFVFEMSQLIASRYTLEECAAFSNLLYLIDEEEDEDEEPVFSEDEKNWSGFVELLGVENSES